MTIDLRSDTVTKPTPGMLEAMYSAAVGDDVFGEDPSINALEAKAAAMFNQEAGLFCPSGTMTNQIAINVQTNPGEEVICEQYAHLYRYEGGGASANSGCSIRLIKGDRGMIDPAAIPGEINPADDHFPITRLVAVENTSNKGGGSCYRLADLKAIGQTCQEKGLNYHLDGARVFNALVKTGTDPGEMGRLFTSISICLSKGLGAPVGSLLLGSKALIKRGHRRRKLMGGGMRQAGYLAAAGSYALDHHIERLAEDHQRAKTIGDTLAGLPFVDHVMPVETNIIVFGLTDRFTTDEFLGRLESHGIKAVAFGPQLIRLVTHLDFTDDMLTETIDVLKKI